MDNVKVKNYPMAITSKTVTTNKGTCKSQWPITGQTDIICSGICLCECFNDGTVFI